jgi:hypothetical protein
MEHNFTIALKTYIEKILGRRILSSTDCRYLHNDIKQKTGLNISFNTLRRFFNLMDTKHEQSVYTLDILARYCGFTTYDNFITCLQSNTSPEPGHTNAELLLYLVMLFKDTEIKDASDFTFYKLVAQTIVFLDSHATLIDEFQFEIARTINGQTFYFEHFVNLDRLNGHYGEGLRYYLNENKTMAGQLFGNYMYCLKHFLSMNFIELKKGCHNIAAYNVNQTKDAAAIAYYFSTQLLYAHATGINPDQILIKTRQHYLAFDPAKECQVTVINFFNTLLQTLVLTEQYEEALFYIDDMLNLIRKGNLTNYQNRIIHNIYLLKAIAVYHNGNKTIAKQVFDTIDPLNFFFLSKEFMTILYLSLKQCFKKSSNEQSQINDLIKKTGFYLLAGKINKQSILQDPIQTASEEVPS